MGDAERLACLRLARSDDIGPVRFRQLINHFGGAEAAIRALPAMSHKVGRKKPFRITPVDVAEAELEAAAKIAAEPIFTIEPGYPYHLAVTGAPPPLLYVKGDAKLLNKPAVAIVGSRQCSANGATVARTFASALGEAGLVIVSGLARGIDGHAHRAALATGTIAVVAGGLDIIYPPEHAELHAAIVERGCLISEKPPGFTPRGQDFVPRNRIISGVSLGVVIVEAAARSGTLTTARFATEQGRSVFAIPGHPLDPRAEGTNDLIKNGATFTTSPNDVLSALAPMTGFADCDALSQRLLAQMPARPTSDVVRNAAPIEIGDEVRAAVFAVLGPAPCDVDAILRATSLSIREVNVALLELTLADRVTLAGSGLYAKAL